MSYPDNLTLQDVEKESLEIRVCDASVFFLIYVFTLVSSAAIFYLFLRTSQLREVSGYLMATITSIDFLTAQFIVCPSIYSLGVYDIPWDNTVFCHIQGFLNLFLQDLKALTITLCALDRLFSISNPFTYVRMATTFNFVIVLLATILLALTCPLVQFGFLGWTTQADKASGICWSVGRHGNSFDYYAGMVLSAFLPGAVVLVSYGVIVVIVIYQRCKIQRLEESARDRNGRGQKNSTVHAGVSFLAHLAACKMLFIVTMLYFLTFVPIIVADHLFQSPQYLIYYHVCNYLAYVSTCTNFLIYYRMSKNFKQAFRDNFPFFRSASNANKSILLDEANLDI